METQQKLNGWIAPLSKGWLYKLIIFPENVKPFEAILPKLGGKNLQKMAKMCFFSVFPKEMLFQRVPHEQKRFNYCFLTYIM